MEIYYTMTDAAKLFLGVSRQQAYNRKVKEGWPETDDSLVSSTTIKKSRDLERSKLLQRVDELDALNSKQQMSDAVEVMKQEHDL